MHPTQVPSLWPTSSPVAGPVTNSPSLAPTTPPGTPVRIHLYEREELLRLDVFSYIRWHTPIQIPTRLPSAAPIANVVNTLGSYDICNGIQTQVGGNTEIGLCYVNCRNSAETDCPMCLGTDGGGGSYPYDCYCVKADPTASPTLTYYPPSPTVGGVYQLSYFGQNNPGTWVANCGTRRL